MILTSRLHELLADNQAAHSDIQMDRFIVLANGLTVYGCYKQSLRELDSRFQTLLGYWIELEELRLDEADAVELADNRRGQLALAKIRLRIMGLQATASETRREFLRFLAHADFLKQQIGELTPDRRAELETEFWVENIRRMGPEQGQRLAMVLSDSDREKIMHEPPKAFPELPTKPAEIDIDTMLRMTVEQKLLPCQAQN